MVRQTAQTGGFGLEVKVMDGKKEFRHKTIRQTEKFWWIWQKKECRFQKEFLVMDAIYDQVLLNSSNVIRF
ncbi:hypothetical protein D3C84_865120 [compost metagenome]